jgi:hypothetical protein
MSSFPDRPIMLLVIDSSQDSVAAAEESE